MADPCQPSPCGPNSICKNTNGQASCSCMPTYIGSPPNCRPECVVNTDCPSDLACITEKCRDPCQGSCGFNAECRVQNHMPICFCIDNYEGDPFTQCNPKIGKLLMMLSEIVETKMFFIFLVKPALPEDPCKLQPCGENARCDNGVCSCFPEYFGDPYIGCRPECTLNTECSPNKACVNLKCKDPCPGTCGTDAKCDVVNHIPMCSCPEGFEGDPFRACRIKSRGTYLLISVVE